MDHHIDDIGQVTEQAALDRIGDGMAIPDTERAIYNDMQINLDTGTDITGTDVMDLQNPVTAACDLSDVLSKGFRRPGID